MRSSRLHAYGSSKRLPRAADIMSAPVDTVSPQAPVQNCQQKMRQLHVGCLPVQDGDRVVGVVTRWDVDKAMEHHLGSQPIGYFMSTPAITVRPGTTFSKMRRLMVERGIGHLPVVGPRGLVGMVSRSDLLKIWPLGEGAKYEKRALLVRSNNLAGLMRERLPLSVRRALKEVGRMGQSVGVDVFLVGGCVRDLLLNMPDVDVDIVVAGDGIAFARKFVARHGGRVVCYRRFATALMVLPGGLKIDVVSARSERYKKPGVLPDIEPSALMHDLYRRDFTINAMAIQLSGRRYGRLIDPFGGLNDLTLKNIKVMHNLSFVEDPTRIIRGVRFESRYGFHMDQRTIHLLRNAARSHMLDQISGQRLREEILILLRERNPLPAIRRLDRLGVLKSLSAELKVTAQLSGLLSRIHRRRFQWESLWPEATVERWIVFLLGLFSILSSPEMERLAARLCLHRKARECLRQARQAEGEVLGPLGASRRPANSVLYGMLHPLHPEVVTYLMISQGRTVSGRIVHYLTHLRDVGLEIGGEDLKKLGLTQGVIYNQILSQVLMAKLDGRLKDRSQELRLATKLAENKGK